MDFAMLLNVVLVIPASLYSAQDAENHKLDFNLEMQTQGSESQLYQCTLISEMATAVKSNALKKWRRRGGGSKHVCPR